MVRVVGQVVATLQSTFPNLASLKSREHAGLPVGDGAAVARVAVEDAPGGVWPLASPTAQAAASAAASAASTHRRQQQSSGPCSGGGGTIVSWTLAALLRRRHRTGT